MALSNASYPGRASTLTADGQAPEAPADMSAACEQAAAEAVSQREQEGRKVALS